jgi:plastocyanin
MRTRAATAVLLLLATALVLARPATSNTASVVILDDGYHPDTVTIHGGDQVSWENDGNADHSVTADDGSFDQRLTPHISQFTATFNHKGTFGYYSNVPGDNMRGTIIVLDDAPTTPPPPTTATTAAPAPRPGTTRVARTTSTVRRTAAAKRAAAAQTTTTVFAGAVSTFATVQLSTSTTPTTFGGPTTTLGEFAIKEKSSSNRRPILAIVIGLGGALAVAGLVIRRRRLRSPYYR